MMDPIDRVLRTLKERLEHLEGLILSGDARSYDMYCAFVENRNMLLSIISDVQQSRGAENDDENADA